MIDMQALESVYNATPSERAAAKAVILAHDPLAMDIVQMLGLALLEKGGE